MTIPTIQTKDLLLRPLTLADAPALFDYARLPNVTDFIHWKTHATLTESVHFIKKALATKQLIWGITVGNNDTIVGECGLLLHGTIIEIHCTLAPTHWGQGIAYQALQALITMSFNTFSLETLQASVIATNERSVHLAHKLGMTHSGTLTHQWLINNTLHDIYIYTLSKNMRAAQVLGSPPIPL